MTSLSFQTAVQKNEAKLSSFVQFESEIPGATSILEGWGAWTSHQVWKQNLGQGPAKFTK